MKIYFLNIVPMNEATLRITFFLFIFLIMAMWEILAPKRVLSEKKITRWSNNLIIVIFNAILNRVIFPIIPVGMAILSVKNNWGLLNNFHIPDIFNVIFSIIILDLAIYIQHVMFHTLPVLWRLHLVHHADLDIDVTTGLRFHPIEIIISMVIKLSVVYILGPSPFAVLIFEIALNGTSMFNHGNIRLPRGLDRVVRLFIVTPDMHRVHHSVIIRETNSNFGFNLSCWDRFFCTYRKKPAAGHKGMKIGLAQYRNSEELSLARLFILPFIADPGKYSINRWAQEPKEENTKDRKN
ncbi:sterol desaturase family protein [Spirochaetota bacterium]